MTTERQYILTLFAKKANDLADMAEQEVPSHEDFMLAFTELTVFLTILWKRKMLRRVSEDSFFHASFLLEIVLEAELQRAKKEGVIA